MKERVARGEVCLDDRDVSTYHCLESAHKQLEVKVRIMTSVAVSPVVKVSRHGNVQEEEVVVEVTLCEL